MLGKLEFIANPGERTILMRRTFDAARTAVFEAWTTPEDVALWWDPTGAPLAICEIDLRPGGTFRWVHQGDADAKFPFTGVYREIAPPERLVFDLATSPMSPPHAATLKLDEQDGRTTLTIAIECASVEAREALLAMRIDMGTARTLDNLAAHLARRPR